MRRRGPYGRRFSAVVAAACIVLAAGCGSDPPAGNGSHSSAGSPSGTQSDHGRSGGHSKQPADSSASGQAPTDRSSAGSSTHHSGKQCHDLAGRLTLNQQVGQLFVAGVDSSGIGAEEASTLSRMHVGSALLLGNTDAGVNGVKKVTDKIKKSVGDTADITMLTAVDQEGGQVQRLAGPGFDKIPSANQQAGFSDTKLTRRASRWGRQLDAAGVDADFAPVADVVPSSFGKSNQPIGALQRGYGSQASQVAAKDGAFIKGMRAAHLANGVKHFPGLGKVRGNTDTETHVVDHRTRRHGRDQAGFRAGVKAGTDMVMLSSARYAKIDPKTPATFSKKVVSGMVRKDLDFDGVVVSDDLQGKALHATASKQRGVKFFRAGGDLAIVGDPQLIEPMVDGVRSAARRDHALRSTIRTSAARVLTMKAHYGLADCR